VAAHSVIIAAVEHTAISQHTLGARAMVAPHSLSLAAVAQNSAINPQVASHSLKLAAAERSSATSPQTRSAAFSAHAMSAPHGAMSAGQATPASAKSAQPKQAQLSIGMQPSTVQPNTLKKHKRHYSSHY
jgi:hypothetical protein